VIKNGEHYGVQFKMRGEWLKLYRFDLSEQMQSDHEAGNWFVSTHPDSIFVNGLIGARAEPDRRYALGNNQLSIHHMNGKSEKRTLNAIELRDALADLFKVRLAGLDGLDTALARLAAGAA
jgi:N-hydroxyarylamine O-acetyltransferase